jgi:hypothetical protein
MEEIFGEMAQIHPKKGRRARRSQGYNSRLTRCTIYRYVIQYPFQCSAMLIDTWDFRIYTVGFIRTPHLRLSYLNGQTT